jgi:hypothetical protein
MPLKTWLWARKGFKHRISAVKLTSEGLSELVVDQGHAARIPLIGEGWVQSTDVRKIGGPISGPSQCLVVIRCDMSARFEEIGIGKLAPLFFCFSQTLNDDAPAGG